MYTNCILDKRNYDLEFHRITARNVTVVLPHKSNNHVQSILVQTVASVIKLCYFS